MRDREQDDIDRIFARLEHLEPPADFVSRVMARIDAAAEAVERQTIWRRGLVYAGAYVATLVALAILAYSAGVKMAHNGTSTLIGTLVKHVEVFAYAPDAYLRAILASIPWPEVAGLALDLVVFAVMTRMLLHGARAFRAPARSRV